VRKATARVRAVLSAESAMRVSAPTVLLHVGTPAVLLRLSMQRVMPRVHDDASSVI
jgi:hypothetical protein